MTKEKTFFIEFYYRNSEKCMIISGIGRDLVNLVDKQMKDKKEEFVHFEMVGKKGPEDIKHKIIAYKEDISSIHIKPEVET